MVFRRGFFARLAVVSIIAAPAPLAPRSALAQGVSEEKQPSAADKETARSLMDVGVDREEAKDYPAALKAYQGAHALVKLPMTGVAVARVQAALGLLVEALDSAAEVKQMPRHASEGPAYAKARADAEALTERVLARTPSLQVSVSGPDGEIRDGVEVSIDDVSLPSAAALLPRKVNPGNHKVAVVAPGFKRATREVDVPEGGVFPVLIPLKRDTGSGGDPGPGPGPSPGPTTKGGLSPLVFVGFGVGAAGIIAGAVSGGISIGKTSEIEPDCDDGHCLPSRRDDISSATTMANISNVTFAIGAAGVVTGVVGLFLPRGGREDGVVKAGALRLVPVVGPSGAGVIGTF